MYFQKLFITFFVSFVSVLSKASAERYVPENVFQNGVFSFSHILPGFVQSTEPVIQKRESFEVPIISRLTHRSKRTVNNNEIPVAVLYDDVTQNPSPKPEKTRRRQGINKKENTTQSTENNAIKDITTTIKPTSTTEKSTARPQGITTFPKRPEADSKRIEFQRRSRARTPVVKILNSQNFVYSHSGNFHYSYDSEDGTKISSEGQLLRNYKNEGTGESVVGNVFYKDDEGKDYNLSYTADENGYRPVGAHLPTPPPIPPAIARALEHLATKKPDPATDY